MLRTRRIEGHRRHEHTWALSKHSQQCGIHSTLSRGRRRRLNAPKSTAFRGHVYTFDFQSDPRFISASAGHRSLRSASRWFNDHSFPFAIERISCDTSMQSLAPLPEAARQSSKCSRAAAKSLRHSASPSRSPTPHANSPRQPPLYPDRHD